MNAYSFRPCGGDFPFAAGTRIPAAAAARRIDKPAQTAKGDEQPVTLTPTVEYESLRDDKSTFYYYKKTLLISLILSFLILAPFVIVEWIKTGSPVFLYYGDYNVQQIPFYEHCVRMVHEGNFGWDWLTDLGSNFIGSYSYYLLGSPFFWLMCLFPASWAPYLMAPIYMLKFATAAVIAYAYLKRFVKNKDYAVIGALLYAFSGFQIYNIFFNQFHEVVAFFPLLLIGMEELVQNNRRGQFALAVAINCMMNYFMFAGQVAFCIMYFMFRCTKRSFRINLKNFLCLAVEAVLGVLIGSVLFLPACLAILDNPRLGGGYEGWRMLFYMHSVDGEQTLYTERYVHIIESYFFPPDIPSRVNFAYGHNERWASNAIWLPLFGMSGVFSYIAARKRSWLSYFSVFLMLCSVVPLLNSSFFLLNSSYYARWNYMMILMFCVATVIALEDRRISFKRGLIANAVACAVIALPIGLRWYQESEGSDWELGTMPYADRFWLYVAIAFGSLIALHFITKYLRGRKTRVTVSVSETPGKRVVRCIERSVFVNGVLIAVCVVTVLYAVLHVFHGKCHSWSSDFLVDQAINGEVELPEEDGFYRIDFYRKEGRFTNVFDNLGLFWQIPSVENFHTVVPATIMEFYQANGISRSVGSRVESKYYGFKSLLSVKYSFIPTSDTKKHDTVGFEYFDTQNGFDIYENQYYLGMGFAFDQFMVESDYEKIAKSQRHILFNKYLVVPDEQAEYYATFMERVYNASNAPDGAPVRETALNKDTYFAAVEERRNYVCDSFDYDSYGFHATISLDAPGMVFFSVPYDDGWSATVNGAPVTVEKVDYGFVAVRADAGDSEIVFSYRTPGLAAGALLSLAGVLLLLLYLFVMRRMKVKASYRFFREDYYESESPDEYLTKRERRRLECVAPSADGTDEAPPADGVEEAPSADGTDTAPPENGADEAPPADGSAADAGPTDAPFDTSARGDGEQEK